MLRFLIVLISCCIMHGALNAQSVIIKGKISNCETNDGIPFATIFVKGTTIKVSSDFDGYYKLRLKRAPESVSVSCLGYQKSYRVVSKKGKEIELNFALVRLDTTMKQKFAMNRNEIQALRIIRKVIDAKPSHNKSKANGYGYEAYTKLQMELVEITERFKSRKLFRPFKFIFNNIDSASENKPFLPFFISETVSDYFFQKKPLAGREIIKASKISGLDDVSVSQFLGTSFAETDIYDDYVVIMKRQFLSPISNAGINSYDYYLEDSEVIDKMKCYRLRFIPKNSKLLRLEGEIVVADSVFAIKQVSMKVQSSSNVNLINGISVYNEFVPVKDSIWMLKKEVVNIGFTKFKNVPEAILRKSATYSNYIINPDKRQIDSLFKNGRPDVSITDSASMKTDGYWQKVRHTSKTNGNEERVYHMIDTLGGLKATKNYINLLQTLVIGFVDVGPISIGNIYTIIGRNDIQGYHFKLAVNTSTKLSKFVRVGAFAAYGLLDKKWRYGGDALWLIKKNPRISLNASYRFDLLANPNASSFFATPEFFTTYGIRRIENGHAIPYKLMDDREIKVRFYQEFKIGYSYAVTFKNQMLNPQGAFDFSYHTAPDNVNPGNDIGAIRLTEFSLVQRFAWKERFVGSNFTRFSLGSKFPVLFFEYAFGVKHIIGSQFNYHRLAFGINDTRLLGPLGKVRLNVEAGKIFGTLPYLILQSPDASETYVSWWPAFNTITKYQFAADRYVKAEFDHHLGGFIFDRIPGFNKLKFREVWGTKMWWGDMTSANQTANYANLAENVNNRGIVKVQTADKTPFIEMNAGIENIGGFFRIDAVWRVTHLDPTGTRFSFRKGNFGVRAALEIQF